MRLYKIRDKETGITRLVESTNGPTGLRHVVADRFEVTVPSGIEVGRLVGDGIKVERAGAQPELPEEGA